jgi:hypothetical protein
MLIGISSFRGAFERCHTEFPISVQTLPMSGRKFRRLAKRAKIRSNIERCHTEIHRFGHHFRNAAQTRRIPHKPAQVRSNIPICWANFQFPVRHVPLSNSNAKKSTAYSDSPRSWRFHKRQGHPLRGVRPILVESATVSATKQLGT